MKKGGKGLLVQLFSARAHSLSQLDTLGVTTTNEHCLTQMGLPEDTGRDSAEQLQMAL